ncbi:MAG: hypothetical protein LKF30_00140 [Sphingobium sp.]|jgi:plasmid stability protein|nr:hypothetical protein [Sphingomonadaceae bacterium]MCH4150351.1 hypothetical protein [Sphingobium sp.]MCI1272146.1 hypothetical protein [Sphingobium sp.]MCI2051737.1 hypothetical protein [Sphingobium sp.]
MKNVTISLDDETHRKARIRAAEMGTSLSALVKQYLESLGEAPGKVPDQAEVRDMHMGYTAPPASLAKPDGPPYWVNGKKVFTPDGKPRQPGALRGKIHMAEDFDEWPEGFIEAMYGEDTDKPWYK